MELFRHYFLPFEGSFLPNAKIIYYHHRLKFRKAFAKPGNFLSGEFIMCQNEASDASIYILYLLYL